MPYSLSFDGELHLLVVRWGRIFTTEEAVDYGHVYMRGFLNAGFRPGYRLLMDMTRCDAQPQATLAELENHMRKIPKASRIAVAATAPLLRNQVRRVMTQPYMRLFDDTAAARGWVVS